MNFDRFHGEPEFCDADYGNENCINCLRNDTCKAYKEYRKEEDFENWANEQLDSIDTILPEKITSKYAKSSLVRIKAMVEELLEEIK